MAPPVFKTGLAANIVAGGFDSLPPPPPIPAGGMVKRELCPGRSAKLKRGPMTRTELIQKERARGKAHGYAFWILGFTIVGGIFAVPSLQGASPILGALTGDTWLVPLLVGFGAISILNQARMSRCPRCRRPLNGAIAIVTDRCASCGEIAIDDPRLR